MSLSSEYCPMFLFSGLHVNTWSGSNLSHYVNKR